VTTQIDGPRSAPAPPPAPPAEAPSRHGLRVLQVCGVADGGAAEHVLQLSTGLVERGWSVHVACPDGWLADAAREVVDGVWPTGFVRPPHPVADARALSVLSGLMRRLRPDLAHLHSSKAGVLGRVAARRHGIVTAFTPHAWSFLAASVGIERNLWIRTERMFAGGGAGVVCVSEDERRRGVSAGVLAPGSSVVIPNGVAVPVEASYERRGAPVIGTLARLARQKGLDVLLDAVAIVARDQPDVRLMIAGGGPLESELRAQAADLGLEHSVDFLGWVENGRSLLPTFDVFVLPSRWEGMPIALLEARAAGLPTVATDVGGAREVIDDGHDGWVVPPEDPEALAHALLDLVQDPAKREAWGRAARTHTAVVYGLPEMVRRTELLYLERLVFAERHV
jgi:glycosyltransferase involved in cell wall biosynthesis